jgi:hypothetical protein
MSAKGFFKSRGELFRRKKATREAATDGPFANGNVRSPAYGRRLATCKGIPPLMTHPTHALK